MIDKLLAAYRAWKVARATRDLLHGLSDRTLSDIGLRREQIDYLGPEHFTR